MGTSWLEALHRLQTKILSEIFLDWFGPKNFVQDLNYLVRKFIYICTWYFPFSCDKWWCVSWHLFFTPIETIDSFEEASDLLSNCEEWVNWQNKHKSLLCCWRLVTWRGEIPRVLFRSGVCDDTLCCGLHPHLLHAAWEDSASPGQCLGHWIPVKICGQGWYQPPGHPSPCPLCCGEDVSTPGILLQRLHSRFPGQQVHRREDEYNSGINKD